MSTNKECCEFCPFIAQNVQILRLHSYKHNYCLPCQILCDSINDFIDHLDSNHGIKHECSSCHQRFLLDLSLKKHEKFCETEPEPVDFNCEICDKVFEAKEILEKHVQNDHLKPLETKSCRNKFECL